MPDNHVNFVFKLDGNIEAIDIFKVAPTLLSLGELIQESNREVNPTGRQIGVNVKPFRKGSFIVDLTVFPQTNLQQVLDLLNTHSVENVKNLLEWIGLITGGTGGVVGVVQLMKWLKGKPKAVDELKSGDFRYTAGDDKSITVSAQVHQLFSSTNITNHIYKVYASPLEDEPLVENVKTYLEGKEETVVKVDREDVPSIREFVESPILSVTENEIVKEHIQNGVNSSGN